MVAVDALGWCTRNALRRGAVSTEAGALDLLQGKTLLTAGMEPAYGPVTTLTMPRPVPRLRPPLTLAAAVLDQP